MNVTSLSYQTTANAQLRAPTDNRQNNSQYPQSALQSWTSFSKELASFRWRLLVSKRHADFFSKMACKKKTNKINFVPMGLRLFDFLGKPTANGNNKNKKQKLKTKPTP